MLDFDNDERFPESAATEAVVSYVNQRIEQGLLRPGDRLPSERELAARTGVSRPSVRSGLRTLAAMGIVQTRHGSGTYMTEGPPVLDPTPLRVLAAVHRMSPEQMFEARCVLEVGAAGLAAERAGSDHLAAIAEEVSGMFATVDNARSFLGHDIRFHRAVAMGSGNPVLASLIEMVSGLFFEMRRHGPQRSPEQLREIAAIHRNIYQAVRAHDPDRARREMSTHLPRSRAAAVAVAMPFEARR
jgi:GntR family transcriptional repressor for pyruvate dehydrogenase complex